MYLGYVYLLNLEPYPGTLLTHSISFYLSTVNLDKMKAKVKMLLKLKCGTLKVCLLLAGNEDTIKASTGQESWILQYVKAFQLSFVLSLRNNP